MNVDLDLTRVLTVLLVLLLGAGGGWLVRLRTGNRTIKGMDVDLFTRVQEIATQQMDEQKTWMREQVESVRRECEERIQTMSRELEGTRRELEGAREDQRRTQVTLTHTQRRVIAYELRVFQLQTAMQRADPPIAIPPWPDEPTDEIDQSTYRTN